MGRWGNWIFDVNLEPFVATLAFLVGYSLYSEDYDWVGIQYGVKDTDVDRDKWYSYPFGGSTPVLLELAQDPNASEVVSVRVTSSAELTSELHAQLDLLAHICQNYDLIQS